MFEYESKISIARPNSLSARTTIPKEVMKFLGAEIGDKVNWIVEYNNGKTEVKIEKVEWYFLLIFLIKTPYNLFKAIAK